MIPRRRGANRDAMIFLWTLVAFLALVVVSAASARTTYVIYPQIDSVVSVFAMRDVSALCYLSDEDNSPWGYGAWGYVERPLAKQRHEHIDLRMCVGAVRVNDRTLPAWQRALGVTVLVHEAYHLRRWGAAASEAKVECKAIRHWKVAARMFGATEETVSDLWGHALASHYRVTEYVDMFGRRPYYDPNCVVPDYLSDSDLSP